MSTYISTSLNTQALAPDWLAPDWIALDDWIVLDDWLSLVDWLSLDCGTVDRLIQASKKSSTLTTNMMV